MNDDDSKDEEVSDLDCPICNSEKCCSHIFAIIDCSFSEVDGAVYNLWKEFLHKEPDGDSEEESDFEKRFDYFCKGCYECSDMGKITDTDGGPGMSSQEEWRYSMNVEKSLIELKECLSKYKS